MLRLARIIAALGISASLAACGGGGGGGSGGSNPSTPGSTGIGEQYYPVTLGATWSYDATSNSTPAAYMDDIEITGTQAIGGTTAYVFHDSNPVGDGVAVDDFCAKTPRAFTYVAEVPTTGLITALGAYDLMRFDGSFSASPLMQKTGIDLGNDFDGDGINEHGNVSLTGIVEGTESLVTAAGTFSNTARIRYDLTISIALSSTGQTVPATGVIREWRAPSIGLVKEASTLTIAGTTSSWGQSLRGYYVDGVAGGVVSKGVLLTDLAAAGSNVDEPGRPGAASDGTNVLLVSNRSTSSSLQWVAQLRGPSGSLISEFNLSSVLSYPSWSYRNPSVVWDGSNYLVVTGDLNGVHGQRVSASGTVVDAYPGALIADDGYNAAAAYGGGTYLVVYLRRSQPGKLFGTIMSPDIAHGGETVLASDATDMTHPAIAFDGTNFLVAWETGIGSATPEATDLVAARVSVAGTTLDATPIPISSAPEAQTAPQVACDAAQCLVTWVDRRNYVGQPYNVLPGPGDLFGAFVSRAGVLMNGPAATGGIPLVTGISANQGYPSLGFGGSDYLLAWSSGAYVNSPGGPTGIYFARVSTAGSPGAPTALSGPPASGAKLPYLTMATTLQGAFVAWLNNTELASTTKNISGAMVFPVVAR